MNNADGNTTRAHLGFFPFVTGDDVHIERAGSTLVVSRGNMAVTQGGSQVNLVGGSLSVNQGGSQVVLARGNAEFHQAGAGVLAATSATVDHGFVGMVVSPRVTLTDSTVLAGPREAAITGVVAGLVAWALSRLARRSRA
jgi:hypothetical protein